MKIYFANSLTQAPEEFKKEMIILRENLKRDFDVLEYLGLVDGSPEDVYKHDIACVNACDLVLAEVTYPSTGVGIEMTSALHLGKKVLAIAKPDAKISRMVLGMIHPNYKFVRYNSIGDVLMLLK